MEIKKLIEEKNKQSVIVDFGNEWQAYNQNCLSENELESSYNAYFSIFPFEKISNTSIGFDAGCGSGRWAKLLASRVGEIHCIDPSESLLVAKNNLQNFNNIYFHQNTLEQLPFDSNSMDFGYCLGVLHHIDDTQKGLNNCVRILKRGAPFLVYIYFNFDNKPLWYYYLWIVSDKLRIIISKFPFKLKYSVALFISIIIYYPLSRITLLLEKLGINIDNVPLNFYRNKSFYTMRTDALDRFGTKVEKRYSRKEINEMLENAGLGEIKYSDQAPFWCALGYKK